MTYAKGVLDLRINQPSLNLPMTSIKMLGISMFLVTIVEVNRYGEYVFNVLLVMISTCAKVNPL